MTQPAQQSPAPPQTAPAAPTGQPAQPAPTSAPPAQPAQPQAPNPYGYAPPTPPQQQTAPPAWPQQVPGQPPTQPYPTVPYLPTTTVPPAPEGDDGQGYDLARLPRAAREEIERLRGQAQQHASQLRTAAISQQAYLLAPQLGANPQALVGSLAWQQAAAALDPAAPDYQQRLAWTIQAIVQANPWMAAQPAPGQPATPPAQPGQQGAPQPPPAPAPAGPTVTEITGQPGTVDTATPGMGRLRNAYGA